MARTQQSQAQRGLNIERARTQDLNKKLDAAKKCARNAAINFGATVANMIIDKFSEELKKQCSESVENVYKKADNEDNKRFKFECILYGYCILKIIYNEYEN